MTRNQLPWDKKIEMLRQLFCLFGVIDSVSRSELDAREILFILLQCWYIIWRIEIRGQLDSLRLSNKKKKQIRVESSLTEINIFQYYYQSSKVSGIDQNFVHTADTVWDNFFNIIFHVNNSSSFFPLT